MSNAINLGERKRKKFLKHVHYFRGFAIINIAIVHILYVPVEHSKELHSTVKFISEILFHNSTAYFLFISGFLFYYISDNFEISKYYKNKFLNIIVPYTFITIFVFSIEHLSQLLHGQLSFSLFLKEGLSSLLWGTSQVQLWYIPFVILIFLGSPLILKLSDKSFLIFLGLAILLPLLGTRTGIEITPYQYVYFVPIYYIGAAAAKYYEKFLVFLHKSKWILLCIAIGTTVFLFSIRGHYIRINSVMNITESIYYLQKLSIGFLAFLLLLKYNHRNVKLLDLLARYSFAIYFLHYIVNFVFKYKFIAFITPLPTPVLLLLVILFPFFIISVTLGISILIKKILGKRSKYFIGA